MSEAEIRAKLDNVEGLLTEVRDELKELSKERAGIIERLATLEAQVKWIKGLMALAGLGGAGGFAVFGG